MDAINGISMVSIVVVLVVVVAILVAVFKIRATMRDIAQTAFGTNSLKEGFEKERYEYQTTPKSLAAATSLYLPQIQRDFPNLNYEEARARAEVVLTSYLHAVDQQDAHLLTEGSDELKDALALRISMLKDAGQREEFDKVSVHRSEIARYFKKDGRCSIVFQVALQSKHALVDATTNKVLKGSLEDLEQSRYEVTMAYVQDQDKVQDDRDRAHGLNCPNCGAPVSTLGQKVCEYCGTGLVPYNIKVWNFVKVEEA